MSKAWHGERGLGRFQIGFDPDTEDGLVNMQIQCKWVDILNESRLAQLRELFNAVLEQDNLVGFPRPFKDHEGEAYFRGLALDVELGRKDVLFVLKDRIELVGTVFLARNPPGNCHHIGEVSKAMIHPKHRGGDILMFGFRSLLDRCADQGIDILNLDARTGSRSEALWCRLGFVPYGTLADYSRVDGKSYAGTYLTARLPDLQRIIDAQEESQASGKAGGQAQKRASSSTNNPRKEVAL